MMTFIERLRGMTKGRVGVPVATTLGLCILSFLLAHYLGSRFENTRVWFDRVKELSLAAIPALMVILVDHFVTINKVATEVTRQIQMAMTDMMEMRVFGSTRAGMVGFHHRLDFAKIIEDLEPGEELLWLDTFCQRIGEFIDKIEEAIAKGARFRMLVINPNSPNASYRAEEFGESETFAKQAEVFLEQLTAVARRNNGSDPDACACKVVLYDSLPGMPIYIVARNGVPLRGYSGFFLSKPSAFFTHVEWIRTEDGVLVNMHNHFEKKWAAAVASAHGKNTTSSQKRRLSLAEGASNSSRVKHLSSTKRVDSRSCVRMAITDRDSH